MDSNSLVYPNCAAFSGSTDDSVKKGRVSLILWKAAGGTPDYIRNYIKNREDNFNDYGYSPSDPLK